MHGRSEKPSTSSERDFDERDIYRSSKTTTPWTTVLLALATVIAVLALIQAAGATDKPQRVAVLSGGVICDRPEEVYSLVTAPEKPPPGCGLLKGMVTVVAQEHATFTHQGVKFTIGRYIFVQTMTVQFGIMAHVRLQDV